MLVLTRRVNETIIIGDNISVTIVSVQGHGAHAQVRLGITAPRTTTVLRREVFEQVHAGDQDRAGADGPQPLPAAVDPPRPEEPAGTAQA